MFSRATACQAICISVGQILPNRQQNQTEKKNIFIFHQKIFCATFYFYCFGLNLYFCRHLDDWLINNENNSLIIVASKDCRDYREDELTGSTENHTFFKLPAAMLTYSFCLGVFTDQPNARPSVFLTWLIINFQSAV